MASLSNDSGGLRRILFIAGDGKRKAIRLGRIPIKQANTILSHVDRLEACQFDGSAPSPQTAAWLASISDTLRTRLVTLGLAAPKIAAPTSPALAELVASFKARPKWRDAADKTRENYAYHFGFLLGRVKAATPIDAVTEADAEDFRGYLLAGKPDGAGLAKATANQACNTSAMLFKFAVRSRLLTSNPFDGIPRGSVATTRQAFVDAADVHLLINAMRDSQWRLLIALARWGGLRTPSEPKLLRWGDVDRERNRITIPEGKTERRIIPLFPELEPFIQERYDDAEPGQELVLPMMQHLCRPAYGAHLRCTLKRLGIKEWPRIFHNMRSTRQTELEQRFPGYVVCQWLGNSESVARRHYLQVTDDHFEQAAQNAAQHTSESPGMTKNTPKGCTVIPVVAR